MNTGAWFFVVSIIVMVAVLTGLALRRRRESFAREPVHGQSVIFATRAAVLKRVGASGGGGWVTLKGVGWPQFLVHPGGLEVTIGVFDVLISGNTVLLKGATMRRERLSTWPLVGGNRDCIRLWGSDGTGRREWKVSPRGTSVEKVWAELVAAGVTPTE